MSSHYRRTYPVLLASVRPQPTRLLHANADTLGSPQRPVVAVVLAGGDSSENSVIFGQRISWQRF